MKAAQIMKALLSPKLYGCRPSINVGLEFMMLRRTWKIGSLRVTLDIPVILVRGACKKGSYSIQSEIND